MTEKFAQWNLLFVEYLKRDWKKILVWIIGVGLFSGAFVPAFQEIAKGQGLAGMYQTMQNPAMTAMVGPTPVDKVDDYTLGAMYANEMLLFCALFALIMTLLHVIGHTRKEEEQGLTELIRSFRVGRQANSLAVMVEILLINLLLAVFIGGLMASFQVKTITVAGSFLFGASVGLGGLIGGALGLLFAQLMPTSAGATGSALSVVGMLYILRAATDTGKISWSMFNPLGWTYLTYPFTENHWLPLMYGVFFCLLSTIAAFTLEGHRDLYGGYLPEPAGRAHAKKSLLSFPGLFYRLNRGIILGWLTAFACLGAAYGSIYGDMQSFLESNALMREMFERAGSSIEASFTATIMMVMIGLTCILPIAIVNKLFTEESHLRLSQVFATKVSRSQLFWSAISLALLAGLIGTVISAGSLAAAALAVMKSNSKLNFSDFLFAGLNLVPIVGFFTGLASMTLGWLPRSGKVIYAYLGYSFALSYFGGILKLPDWFLQTSALNWLPELPVEKFDAGLFSLILGISLILLIAGLIGYKRRDMQESA